MHERQQGRFGALSMLFRPSPRMSTRSSSSLETTRPACATSKRTRALHWQRSDSRAHSGGRIELALSGLTPSLLLLPAPQRFSLIISTSRFVQLHTSVSDFTVTQ